jgi:hypothetical protein
MEKPIKKLCCPNYYRWEPVHLIRYRYFPTFCVLIHMVSSNNLWITITIPISITRAENMSKEYFSWKFLSYHFRQLHQLFHQTTKEHVPLASVITPQTCKSYDH